MVVLRNSFLIFVLLVSFTISSQIENYCNTYYNVFKGAKSENDIAYKELRLSALMFHMGVDGFIKHLLESQDEIMVASGKLHETIVIRHEQFERFEMMYSQSNLKIVPIVMYYDKNIASAMNFQFSIPISFESWKYIMIIMITTFVLLFTLIFFINFSKSFFS